MTRSGAKCGILGAGRANYQSLVMQFVRQIHGGTYMQLQTATEGSDFSDSLSD